MGETTLHVVVLTGSTFDPRIPGGSQLADAVNIDLQTMGHFRILGDPRLLHAVYVVLSRDL